MTRFSEIAENIECQYVPDFDWDRSETSPPVRYIEHRLLELCQLLDARLTALEGAKPQATDPVAEIHVLEMDAYHAKGDLIEAEAEIERLIAERDGFELAYQKAVKERNTLAAQVDDLRNVNAGLRKHNASQQDLLVSGRLRSLRRIEALLAVEWVTGECPWCGNSHREGHEEDCPRQAALR